MGYETLIVERHGKVGWLIFNRPDQLNAMSRTMIDELPQAWSELDADPNVHVIVNTGMGRGFQTGLDMKETARRGLPGDRRGPTARYTGRANRVWKPVICGLNGICAGMGLLFVLDSDFVIASSNATIADPHVTVGQVSALEPIGLMGRVPFGNIMRMVLMGRYERIDARRAYELGMVTQVADPPERLRETLQEVAETMARNSPTTMMASKRAIWQAVDLMRRPAFTEAHKIIRSHWGHPDNLEGPRAFAERREPRWVPPQGSPPPQDGGRGEGAAETSS